MADYKVSLTFTVRDEDSTRDYVIEQTVTASKPNTAIAQMVMDLPVITGQITVTDARTTLA